MATSEKTGQTAGVEALAGKYLAFALSGEKYGLQILKVQEIIGVMHFTTIPRCPDYLKGMINLRGKVIPVVDLRVKFGLPPAEYDEKTCIIVVNAKLGARQIAVGVVVDTVLEVMNFQGKDIQPPPEYGAGIDTNFLLGMGRTSDGSIIILIDIEKALDDGSMAIPAALDAAGTIENK